jgi:uncharacterized protein
MNYRRATPTETAGSSLQGTVLATYSQLVELFGEPEPDADPKVCVSWDVQFDDSTIATLYLWKEPSIPADMHEWNVGGHSLRAVTCIREALSTLPDDVTHRSPPQTRLRSRLRPCRPWTKLDRALSRACAAGDVSTVQFFIEMGADINGRSPVNDGENVPLEEAIQYGHYAVIKALLAAGANVNIRGPYGQTPLCRAAVLADQRIIQLLLDNGADAHAANYAGTPADWARRFNRHEIAEFIESRQASR